MMKDRKDVVGGDGVRDSSSEIITEEERLNVVWAVCGMITEDEVREAIIIITKALTK